MISKFFSVLVGSAVVAALLIGCAAKEQPFTDNSKDADAFATSIKRQVFSTVDLAKTSREPADTLRTLVTTLSELDAAPKGEHGATYDELYASSKSLLEATEKAKPSDFQHRLDEIASIAKKLPGEVTIEKESGSDR